MSPEPLVADRYQGIGHPKKRAAECLRGSTSSPQNRRPVSRSRGPLDERGFAGVIGDPRNLSRPVLGRPREVSDLARGAD